MPLSLPHPGKIVDSKDFMRVWNVCSPLGVLHYLRVWHDNSGEGPWASWFLKYIIVRDLQTLSKTHFICQKWFALEKDDGAVSDSLARFAHRSRDSTR